jgi:hypothetical protein
MSFSIQRYPDQPVLMVKLFREYNLSTDFAKSYPMVLEHLEKENTPIFYVMDLSDASFDFETLIVGASKTSRGAQGTFHHPKVKEVLIVSPNDIIHAAAEGLTSDVYGNAHVKAFMSVDDALAYARSAA